MVGVLVGVYPDNEPVVLATACGIWIGIAFTIATQQMNKALNTP